jgi:hypothetical protein
MTDHDGWLLDALADEPATLSAAGSARRAAMRGALSRAVVRRRRVRRTVRGTCATAALVAMAVALWQAFAVPSSRPTDDRPMQVAAGYAGFDFREVLGDPGILARCAAPSRPIDPAVFVDDAELLALLRANHRATGLLRVAGRTVPTEPVVDPLPTELPTE